MGKSFGAASLLLALAATAPAPAIAAGNPWLGTWLLKPTGPAQRPETLVYSDAGGGAMRMVSVEDRHEIVTRFDGKPAPDRGAGASGELALAIRSTSPVSYTWTMFKAGKPWVRGRNVLAADGRSFSEVSWLVAKPDRRLTFRYERQ